MGYFQEASTAKYIVQQYIAATGGQTALSSVNSMCAIGEVKISASEFYQSDLRVKVGTTEEMGGFVLWQKNPDLWWLELVVSGCKVISGSNGKLSWRQSSNQQSDISKGAPRPLRRFLQVCIFSNFYAQIFKLLLILSFKAFSRSVGKCNVFIFYF